MKIVAFQAGLGNQIFQYAYYSYLKKQFPNEKIYGFYPSRGLQNHNGLELNKWFDVKLPQSTKLSNVIAKTLYWTAKVFFRLHVQPPFTDNDWYRMPNAILYLGFWQDKKYMLSAGLPEFKKGLDLGEENLNYLKKMDETESVAVHVRRGDYTDSKIQFIYGNIGTLDFYHEAIEIFKQKLNNPHFFFFSDDPEYVKTHFHEKCMDIVSCNHGNRSFFDLYLMAHSKNMIIPNSTFSCWAAYLNKNNPLVVCPKKWRNDKPSPPVILDSWIKI